MHRTNALSLEAIKAFDFFSTVTSPRCLCKHVSDGKFLKLLIFIEKKKQKLDIDIANKHHVAGSLFALQVANVSNC